MHVVRWTFGRALTSAITVSILSQPPAFAAESETCQGPCAVARSASQEGARLYGAGKYTEALEKFEEAHRTVPVPAGLINLARTERRLGRCGPAMEYARQCARMVIGRDSALTTASADLLAHLEASCPEIKITSRPSGADVWVDDFAGPPATTPLKGRLTLGQHVVRLRASGLPDLEQTLEVSGDATLLLVIAGAPVVVLTPAAPRQQPEPVAPSVLTTTTAPASGRRPAAVTLLVLSGASVLATAGLAISYASERNTAQQDGPIVSTSARSEATNLRTASFVTGSAAIAAGLAGGILLFLDRRVSVGIAPTPSPGISVSWAGDLP